METALQHQSGLRALLASRNFVRLWTIGTLVSAMRWMETLAAGLFVFEVTGSGLAVALVSAARTLPMLLFGAVAGVISETLDRKRILQIGLILNVIGASAICLLAWSGQIQPWHVALAGFVSGLVWASEMSTRRRMCGEAAGIALMPRAVALDSLTGATTRGVGPLIGSIAFASLGVVGAYGISAIVYLIATCLVPGVLHVQESRRLALGKIPRELAEGLAFARTQKTVIAVMAITVAMNMFGFSYTAVIAPLALGVFGVDAALAGVLAAAEPVGSLIGGLMLASGIMRRSPRVLMLAGSALFLGCLSLVPFLPFYPLAVAVLMVGGLGLALFSNMQTTLVLTGVPPQVRSRQMGLITVCIGSGPIGQVLLGLLAQSIGLRAAILVSALVGLGCIAGLASWWTRAERRD